MTYEPFYNDYIVPNMVPGMKVPHSGYIEDFYYPNGEKIPHAYRYYTRVIGTFLVVYWPISYENVNNDIPSQITISPRGVVVAVNYGFKIHKHRLYGPAKYHPSHKPEWYIMGYHIPTEQADPNIAPSNFIKKAIDWPRGNPYKILSLLKKNGHLDKDEARKGLSQSSKKDDIKLLGFLEEL